MSTSRAGEVFSSVFLTLDQLIPGTWETIIFQRVETDGQHPNVYNNTTGQFTAPVSGWYDVEVQIQSDVALSGVRIIRDGDGDFPIVARVPTDRDADIKARVRLADGETTSIQVIGPATVEAFAGTTPNARVTNAIFTLVKAYNGISNF